jgi:uncharacterized protein (DUF58 family)
VTLRSDTHFPTTGTDGLTNARTRIVGTRTGLFAEIVVAVVRVATVARDWFRKVTARARDVVTPLGWVMLVFVPMGLAFGYTLGWLELIVAAWAAAVLLVVALVYLIGQPPLTVALRLPRVRTVVGEPVSGELAVGNPGRLRTVAVTLEVPIGEGLAQIVVPGIPSHGDSVQDFTIPALHRGVVTVGPVRTVRADPLGLVRRERIWTAENDLFIHPRTIGIAGMSTGFVRDLEGSPTKDLTTSDISFHALREYMPGDERRNIHWKSTARTGRYMVRQFEETRRSHLVIALSLASADYASDEEFELAVSVAGSLGVRAIRDTRDLSVIVSERTPEFAKRKVFAIKNLSTLSRNRLLDDLALVEKNDAALSLLDVSRVAGTRISGVSVAFVICGSATTPVDIRAASTKFPIGVEVIAVVCDPNSVPGLRQVAGLSVLTIGFLEDLNRSLLKATT